MGPFRPPQTELFLCLHEGRYVKRFPLFTARYEQDGKVGSHLSDGMGWEIMLS